MEDQQLLKLVREERQASIGMEYDDTLVADREQALKYSKGQMDDVPALPNRSRSVSTDVNDAIETVLPDLIEIFTGGEDVVTFRPVGEEDEDAAAQETDFIRHVFFEENPGFMVLYTMFKDALQSKTGVVTWWWEDYKYEEEELDVDPVTFSALQGDPSFEILSAEPQMDEASIKVSLRRRVGGGCAKAKAVPPEDFTVARDTVDLSETTYCAMRSRPRAQQLIADGYDEELVAKLPAYTLADDEIELARDTAAESEQESSADRTLRQVEIIQHFIRVRDGDRLKIMRVVTGGDETVLLEAEEVERIRIAAITPYPQTHRFYGRSLADLLIEVQKIKTALLRMMLDCGYFALNQRVIVGQDQANEYTVPDLLRNEPGVPIRAKTAAAIQPVAAAQLNFSVQDALEYVSTMAEVRTGVLRNAQGLNPDSLHETKGGMMQMASMAQKRIRLIARIFAETGVKDLFLGLHAMIREHGQHAEKARLRNKWVAIDPTRWGSRNDMTIEIGVGSGGQDYELQRSERLANILERASSAAPVVTPDKVYNAASDAIRALGYKDPERYIAEPQEQQPQPDPAAIKAQTEMALKVQELEMKDRLERDRMEREFYLREQEMRAEFELKAESNRVNAIIRGSQQTNMRAVQPGGAVG